MTLHDMTLKTSLKKSITVLIIIGNPSIIHDLVIIATDST